MRIPSQPNVGIPIVAGERVEQGSPDADTLVRGFLRTGGQRLELGTIVQAPAEFGPGTSDHADVEFGAARYALG